MSEESNTSMHRLHGVSAYIFPMRKPPMWAVRRRLTDGLCESVKHRMHLLCGARRWQARSCPSPRHKLKRSLRGRRSLILTRAFIVRGLALKNPFPLELGRQALYGFESKKIRLRPYLTVPASQSQPPSRLMIGNY